MLALGAGSDCNGALARMTGTEKPLGVSIIICDKVITEAGTMNKTLVSTFNSIRAKAFPCVHPALAVYVALTNTTGEKEVKLVFCKENKRFTELGGKLMFEHPNKVVELIFNLRNLPFPEAGIYTFEVWADNEYVFESRLNALKVE
jgi:hypothetical protein